MQDNTAAVIKLVLLYGGRFTPKELLTISLVNNAFRHAADTPLLWRNAAIRAGYEPDGVVDAHIKYRLLNTEHFKSTYSQLAGDIRARETGAADCEDTCLAPTLVSLCAGIAVGTAIEAPGLITASFWGACCSSSGAGTCGCCLCQRPSTYLTTLYPAVINGCSNAHATCGAMTWAGHALMFLTIPAVVIVGAVSVCTARYVAAKITDSRNPELSELKAEARPLKELIDRHGVFSRAGVEARLIRMTDECYDETDYLLGPAIQVQIQT